MVYKWKSGSYIKGDAQKAGEQFERLAKSESGLTPESVLNANRRKGTPLHDSFEWDDSEAAEKYRLNQAGHFIRCIVSVAETDSGEKKEPQRAFFVTTEVHQYEPLNVILQEKDKYEKLLDTAFRELAAFRRKYEALKELQPIFNAIEQAENGKDEKYA